MRDEYDEYEEEERRDAIRREPARRAPRREEEEFDEDQPRRSIRRSPFPRMVQTAGVIWIVFGSLILLNGTVNLLLSFTMKEQVGGAESTGRMCGVLLILLFGAVFIHVGVQSVRGTARDTLGNGIGSVIFALLAGGVGAVMLVAGFALGELALLIAVIAGGIYLLAGLGLLAAGVMALAGREEYKAWKQSQQRPRRRRTRDDDDF